MHFPPAVLKTYRRRLTNLSSRNRSLLLSSLPVDQFVDLHEADFRLNKPSFDLVAGLIARKPHQPLCAVSDPRDERTNALSKHLRRLARLERFIADERGTEDLYVGWPFVRGRFNDGTPVHGPLLFFPVHLTAEGNEWRLERRGDGAAQFNQSMGLAYGHFNGIRLSDDWLDPDVESFDKDPLTFRMQLYDWLKASPFELNFNTRNFTNLLQPFDRQSAKALTQLGGVGELTLMPEAVLGIFPQAGSFLVPDYDQLLAEAAVNATDADTEEETDFFPTLPPPIATNRPIREVDLLLPLPVDASQEAAVRAVKAGGSVVVQGPPGTGKSQLIANLMADAAAQGKRVLLVCQKRAALDVVHQRLKQVGMEPFTALVHDFQDDRKPLYAQLAAQIDAVEGYEQQNKGLDAVLLDREFAVESRHIDALLADLQSFKDALFDTTHCGVSIKELYLSSRPPGPGDAPGPSFTDLFRQFRFDTMEPFREQLGHYLAYRNRIGLDHPFRQRVDFSGFTGQHLTDLYATIGEAAQAIPALLRRAETLLGRAISWAAFVDEYAPHRHELDSLTQPLTNPLVWAVLTRMATEAVPQAAGNAFTARKKALDELAQKGLLQTTDAHNPADRLGQGIAARQSVFSWLFYSDKPYLTDLARQHGLTTSLADLRKLETRWQNRQTWTAQARELAQAFAGPAGANLWADNAAPEAIQQALQQLNEAVTTAETAWQTLRSRFPLLLAFIRTDGSGDAFEKRLMDVRLVLADGLGQQTRWLNYLISSQLSALAADPAEQTTRLQTALRADADNLIEMDRIWVSFTTPERQAADRVDSLPAFDNALRLVWIDDIERQHPELRSVSSLKMSQQEAALQQRIRQKQGFTHTILGLKLREQTYQSLLVNRLNNRISYRELRHQVTKKRSIWPIRKLMEHYADEVFRLVPCWLASPESVSTLFPMQRGLFDLVIFDEASQCFAENGLPAMLRGKQVVVTGDSKQLRPSDLYRARFDPDEPADEGESAVPLEVESLLDLAAHYLPQLSLTGHYRSRSLDLIAFSNAHFYNDALTLLPDFAEVNNAEPGIRYLHVEGQWVNQTNPVEAGAVLTLIGQLQTELPGRSVGVVTFNFQQQQLIQDLLESAADNPSTPGPEAVQFVKNIENVQGDECDIIIFSVGYAADEKGRLSAQFGSLNAAGGENRLNVAITRARERTYVITSLYPHQLLVENAVNEGPKLLKAYLHYALDVAQGRFKPQPRPVAGIRAGGLLKNQLSATHPGWQPELPFADLTIRENGQYQGLILTDDDQYFGQTPKEAHAYRPFALSERHWPFQRRWSRELWRNDSAPTR